MSLVAGATRISDILACAVPPLDIAEALDHAGVADLDIVSGVLGDTAITFIRGSTRYTYRIDTQSDRTALPQFLSRFFCRGGAEPDDDTLHLRAILRRIAPPRVRSTFAAARTPPAVSDSVVGAQFILRIRDVSASGPVGGHTVFYHPLLRTLYYASAAGGGAAADAQTVRIAYPTTFHEDLTETLLAFSAFSRARENMRGRRKSWHG